MKASLYFLPHEHNIVDSGKKFMEYFGDMDVNPTDLPVYHIDLGVNHDIKGVLEKFRPHEMSLDSIAMLILQENKLLKDFKFNVFYVRDPQGILRIVDVYHDGTGWFICSRTLDDQRKCIVHRLFSPEPFGKVSSK